MKRSLLLVSLILLTIGFTLWYSEVSERFLNTKAIMPSEVSLESLSGYFRTSGDDVTARDEDKAQWKTILYWSNWFASTWDKRFGLDNATGLLNEGCPSWRCHFTYNRSLYNVSDAVLFRALIYKDWYIPKYRPSPNQRWVWVEVEPPPTGPARNARARLRREKTSKFINWTMTYHSKSDIMGAYGYFISINGSRPFWPNLMSSHESTMEKYLADYKRGMTLEEVMGPSWKDFVSRPKPVAWMSSHCPTNSRREQYIEELSNYIQIDKYGSCGTLQCKKSRSWCFETTMKRNYSFYLSMENNICEEYISEKLYLPLQHNLVPIVWGGADYSQFLPKGSYIDARQYHPRELAMLLTRLRDDPVAYGRYHVWRGYFAAIQMGSLCELCHRLHTDSDDKFYDNIPNWRDLNNKCVATPKSLFHDPKDPTAWKKLIFSNFAR